MIPPPVLVAIGRSPANAVFSHGASDHFAVGEVQQGVG